MGKKVIIVCEKCGTTYEVADNAIPENGRMLRCANCSHQWLQRKQTEIATLSTPLEHIVEQPIAQEPIASHKESVVKPIAPTPKPASKLLTIAPLVLLFLLIANTIIFYSDKIIKHFPVLSNLYLSQNIFDTKDMVIADVVLQKHLEKNANNANLSIKVTNYSKVSKHLPLIKIIMKDKAGEIITDHIIEQADVMLDAGESHLSNSTIFNLSDTEEFINVHIGNKIELLFRD
jgi:predicted Zn finger-like uncharacterized protein